MTTYKYLTVFFVYDCLKGLLPDTFKDTITHVSHRYNTRSVIKKQLKLPKVKTTKYGFRSITYNAIHTWNMLINKNIISEDMKRNKLKRFIYNFYLAKYSQN